jgi:integrase
MSKKTGLPAYVRWHKGHPLYQRPDRFGGSSKRIKAEPGTPEFWRIYAALEAGQLPDDHRPAPQATEAGDPRKSSRGGRGSFRWVADLYLKAKDTEDAFIPQVRSRKVAVFNQFAEWISPHDGTRTPIGKWPVDKIESHHVGDYLTSLDDIGRWNLHLDMLKPLFAWCCATTYEGRRLLDRLSPLHGMKRRLYRTADGRKRIPYAWTQDDVDAFKARHPVGSRARLAFDLIYHLWVRRSDVTRLGPDHLKEIEPGEWWWIFPEFKGARSSDPKTHRWPCDPELKASVDAYVATYKRHPVQDVRCRSVYLTYVGNGPIGKATKGQRELPFYLNEGAWFNRYFRRWVAEAGLSPLCTPHGIRRGEAVEAGHSGDDINQIRARLGHSHVNMTMVYLKHQVDNRLAQEQMRAAAQRRAAKGSGKGKPARLRLVGGDQ